MIHFFLVCLVVYLLAIAFFIGVYYVLGASKKDYFELLFWPFLLIKEVFFPGK